MKVNLFIASYVTNFSDFLVELGIKRRPSRDKSRNAVPADQVSRGYKFSRFLFAFDSSMILSDPSIQKIIQRYYLLDR